MTTTFAAFAFVLLALSTPALAEPGAPARTAALKLRFTLRDGPVTRTFRVALSPDGPCATAHSKLADREFEVMACASRTAQLSIDWAVRGASGEYHSTSSIPLERGGTAELGSGEGPQLTVAME